jgi:hypothetical protein
LSHKNEEIWKTDKKIHYYTVTLYELFIRKWSTDVITSGYSAYLILELVRNMTVFCIPSLMPYNILVFKSQNFHSFK